MSGQSPYEQVRFIRDVIKDRTDKSQPTFFSVKLESFGSLTPLVDKEQGSLFYDTIIQYLMRYDLSALVVELYRGKSHNIKEPFQSFRILIKRSPNVNLSGFEKREDLIHANAETIISPEKHFQSMATKEFDLLRLQYENDVLKKKNKKKKEYIKQLERELQKAEKEKANSLGNVTLSTVASGAMEKFARSQFGIGLLKDVFGAKDEVINGLLGTETEEGNVEEKKSTATIVKKDTPEKEEPKNLSENEKIRLQILKQITSLLESSDDAVLRLYYELILLIGKDLSLLQSLFMQIKKYKDSLDTQTVHGSQQLKKVENNEDTEENTDDTS